MGWLNMTWTWAATQVITAARLNVIKSQIEAVLNGNIDMNNLSSALRIYQSKTLYLLPPTYNVGTGLYNYTYSPFSIAEAVDFASWVPETPITITRVSARSMSALSDLNCHVYINGVKDASLDVTPSLFTDDPATTVPPAPVTVLAGQKIAIRISNTAAPDDVRNLPIEYTIHYKVGISAG